VEKEIFRWWKSFEKSEKIKPKKPSPLKKKA